MRRWGVSDVLAVRGVSHIRGRAASESPLPHAASPDCAARKSLILLALSLLAQTQSAARTLLQRRIGLEVGGLAEMARWALPIAGSQREARSALDAYGCVRGRSRYDT